MPYAHEAKRETYPFCAQRIPRSGRSPWQVRPQGGRMRISVPNENGAGLGQAMPTTYSFTNLGGLYVKTEENDIRICFISV
jgi:hypothetical protein